MTQTPAHILKRMKLVQTLTLFTGLRTISYGLPFTFLFFKFIQMMPK